MAGTLLFAPFTVFGRIFSPICIAFSLGYLSPFQVARGIHHYMVQWEAFYYCAKYACVLIMIFQNATAEPFLGWTRHVTCGQLSLQIQHTIILLHYTMASLNFEHVCNLFHINFKLPLKEKKCHIQLSEWLISSISGKSLGGERQHQLRRIENKTIPSIYDR